MRSVVMLDILLQSISLEMNILSLYTLIWQKQDSQEVHTAIFRLLYFDT